MPLLGEKVPSFTAKTTHGVINFPDDFKGKWIVLFSHPADFTPVCTTEFVAFQKRFEEFKEKLGVEIKFPIIADDTGEIAKKYGMIHPGKGTNTVRAVFIIDPNGVLRAVLYYPQEVGRNMDEILRLVKALQTSDEYKVALPANWPNNELIGSRAIIPPATDEKTAKERLERAARKEIECYDWWFCHKELK